MTVVGVCAPPEHKLLSDKEQIYHKLNLVDGRCPAGGVLVILGDFNAQTGRARDDSCLGPEGFGAWNKNKQVSL